uniref:Golgi associated RAB2 interactor protein-like Rab2B-binding domain-containing protein n=1 Tax=Gopherus agassizii TaxID=38772 RepID=A0A452I6C9_9SAUR
MKGLFLADDPASGVHLGVEGGILCQLLRSPDYNLFPKSAVFESNFIQVTKQGNWVDIHNAPTLVTLGVTSSEPCLPLPNVLLIARLPAQGPRHRPATHSCPWGLRHPVLSLGSRLLPLRYVRLSVQDSSRRLLRVQVVTGKVYYLRLHQAHPDAVFMLWSRLADILQRGLSITTKDPAIHVPHSLVLSVGSSSTSSPAQVRRLGMRRVAVPERCSGTVPHKARQDFGEPPLPQSRLSPGQEAHTASPPGSLFGAFGILCPSVRFPQRVRPGGVLGKPQGPAPPLRSQT